jgi:hypothetical protein
VLYPLAKEDRSYFDIEWPKGKVALILHTLQTSIQPESSLILIKKTF